MTDDRESLINSKEYMDNAEIESAEFPNVTLIGDHGFAGCTKLKTATFPSVTLIGDHSFAKCSELTEVTLSSDVLIGSGSFEGCKKLTKVSYIDNGEDAEYLMCGSIYSFKDCPVEEIHFSKTLKEAVEKADEKMIRLGADKAVIYFDLEEVKEEQSDD